MDVTSFILGFKKGAASGTGGGSVEGVHTVTFMSEDGSAVLYERLVVDGDDCANVVDRGLLVAPTKASTAQYNYTHSGWSLTKGGAADASALKSVTADRTVYAAFASAVIYYTITYYDSDGTKVLRTDTLPYGSMPSYTPEKDGFSFNGWEPVLATVTGDASYYSQWVSAVTFAGGNWADIAEIAEIGQAANYFKVGDTREELIGENTYTLEIIGFNQDDLSDGTGKAGITIWCKDSIGTCTKGVANSHPWVSGNMHVNYEEPFFDSLGENLKAVVKTVKKQHYTGTTIDTASVTSGDAKIWSLSAAELGYRTYSDGQVYEKFSENTNKTQNKNTYTYDSIKTGYDYWLRTPNTIGGQCYVHANGYLYYSTGTNNTHKILPCFCI